ncbi:MAG TPA: 50S ribosomal protein L22 [Spirochaetota bacterium]|nr:50S ribosomal protein L22 [Spirochaetota bacterium]HOS33791.1 50S ribosomal protein L22 [Spirochaetota bacterium]HOS55063.1 50S ribosomal protein L22 [Spirochaetota bacterium]HPK63138.1 50S ribosomal protein L22 [Spirochaetota bacterium]HQF77697.1 50S ribosomal protein L22 [Spirochaetota bacterium]
MTSVASLKYIRISPYKVRRVANELKNKSVIDAESYLSVLTNRGAAILKDLIHSARSNYLNKDRNADEQDLYIKKILVDGGPTMKRFHPIAKGRASKILKRTCHVKIEVGSRGDE